jgi:hypothetical protein
MRRVNQQLSGVSAARHTGLDIPIVESTDFPFIISHFSFSISEIARTSESGYMKNVRLYKIEALRLNSAVLSSTLTLNTPEPVY